MTYIDYETCSECGFQMAYGGECGECADRRPKAARTPADDAGEVAALIGAIDAHHAALSEDVLLEAIVQEMLATDGLTETSSGGLYSVHEDDLEVLAKAALCTVRAADDAAEVEGAYNEMSYRLGEARAEADRLRVTLAEKADEWEAHARLFVAPADLPVRQDWEFIVRTLRDILAAGPVSLADVREVPKCVNCGHPIRRSARSSTGWEHYPDPPDPREGWQGIRCPGRLTGAEAENR